MATLIEYLDRSVLEQLAASFRQAAGETVWILSPDGGVLAGPPAPPASQAEKVMLDGEHVGTVAVAAQAGAPARSAMLALMREALTRLCAQGRQLRDRVEELAAVYRVTEEFSGRTDLREVHRLVAESMVKVTGADACSIRVFNEDRTELMTIAAYGLSEAYLTKGPILLSESRIDQEVLASGQCVYVADERSDPRVLYQQEARSEGIVSALCAPMSYKGGVEGVIRVYTKRVHEFDWFETSLIRAVAAQAGSAIVNARLYNEALAAADLRRQVRMAAEVQRRMIPASPPKVAGLDIAALYVPSLELAGDFYDFLELPGGNLGVCVADVAGKGVRASLLMASTRSALRAHAAHLYELSLILAAVNVGLWRESQASDFVTMFYGVIDVPRRRLTFASAGHEPALLIRAGQVQALGGQGGVLGMDPTARFSHEAIELRRGDALVICTDGLPEAINFQDEAFGRRRVRAAALAAWGRGEAAEGIAKHLLWEMRRFAGLQTRLDDLTLVVIRVQ